MIGILISKKISLKMDPYMHFYVVRQNDQLPFAYIILPVKKCILLETKIVFSSTQTKPSTSKIVSV